MYRMGQPVVCIGRTGSRKPPGFWEAWRIGWGVTLPTRGTVYTVRDVKARRDGSGYSIRLAEIQNPIIKFIDAPDQEPWFWAEGFRPVLEKATSISVFEEILRGASVAVPERVS